MVETIFGSQQTHILDYEHVKANGGTINWFKSLLKLEGEFVDLGSSRERNETVSPTLAVLARELKTAGIYGEIGHRLLHCIGLDELEGEPASILYEAPREVGAVSNAIFHGFPFDVHVLDDRIIVDGLTYRPRRSWFKDMRSLIAIDALSAAFSLRGRLRLGEVLDLYSMMTDSTQPVEALVQALLNRSGGHPSTKFAEMLLQSRR